MPDTKDRDRSPRRDRKGGRGGGNRKAPPERRIFVSNIPFEMKWQEVKDLFRNEVGDVTYVELFNDENDKPRGCGILEFSSEELAKKAVEKMHRYDLKGRKLVVKEDYDFERDKYGKIVRGSSTGRDRDRDRRGDSRPGPSRSGGGGNLGSVDYGNTYGLSPQFLSTLGIDCPLHTRIFVANLSYDVDEKKLREVFRLAGRVVSVELNRDKDNKSRGHGVIEYSHPVEAVQAISMFNDQSLYDRKMIVRFDKQPGPLPEELDQLPSRLPEGLSSVGMGLGSGGNPLTNVAANLPSAQTNSNNLMAAGGGGGNMDNVADFASTLGNLQNIAALARQMGLSVGGGGSMMGNNGPAGSAGNMGGAAGSGPGMMSNLGGNLSSGAGGMGSGMSGGMGNLGGTMGGSGGLSNMMGGGAGGPGSMAGGMGAVNSMSAGGMGVPDIGMGGRGGAGAPSGSGMMGRPGGATGAGYSSGSNAPGYATMSGPGMDGAPGMRGPMGGPGGAASNPMRSDCIIVRNLPLETNWQTLREGFSHCGDIKYAEMKERGTGMIRFNTERDAERAVSMMDKQNIGGREIDVRLY